MSRFFQNGIFDFLSLFNVLIGLTALATNLIVYKRTPIERRWIRLMYAFLGLYWAGLYLYFFILPDLALNLKQLGPILVRPGVTLTLAMLVSDAIVRYRTKSEH